MTAAVAMLAIVAGVGMATLLLAKSDASSLGQAIQFRSATAQTPQSDGFASMMASLADVAPRKETRTNRSEQPFWIITEPLSVQESEGTTVLFPSRHAESLRIWIVDSTGNAIDHVTAERGRVSPGISAYRGGFGVELPTNADGARVVARIVSSGPARISVEHWRSEQLELTTRRFDQTGGMLFGSLLMIAAFGAVTSLLTRDVTFFLYAGWVVASLRFASYSGGWDLAWLGAPAAEDYPTLVRNLPLAAYALLMVALFREIFKRDIPRVGGTWPLRTMLLASCALLILAIALPHRLFLPVLWAVAVPSLITLFYLTVRVFYATGSSAALWYGASWVVTLLGAANEVAFASGFSWSRPTYLNSLTGSVFSALLAGVAIAERIKTERTGRMQAQARAVTVLNRFRENYNSMPVGLFSLSTDGQVTLSNPYFRSMFPLSSRVDGQSNPRIDQLLGIDALAMLKRAASDQDARDIELHTTADGSNRWFLARASQRDVSIEVVIQDISARKEAETRLKHLVDHDHLTGCLNRRGMEATLQSAVAAAQTGTHCALAYVDLDRFRLINDLHGHGVGDALLQDAAQRLKGAVRSRDSVARIADSFVVVFFDCPENAVAGLTERMREAISERAFEIGGIGLNMTASVGVVSIGPRMRFVDALAAADRACNEAKSRGRNCVVRLTDQDSALRSHLEELQVVADLQQRIPTDRYFLEFQPIVALQAPMASLSYEVLIRMRGERGETIPPGKFIGAAERNGLMSQIDRWVLLNTLQWLDSNPEHRERVTFATINISGASLNDTRFVDDAFSMIAEHPLAMPKLCFEITESVALHDLGSTRRFVDRVRMYGSKLALDDFGAGYTSFNYLKEIPADFIKIDGSFVKDINRNPANYAITRTIVDLTHELGMRSIAEWAETPDTIASLIDLGVDYGQGFGLVRPSAPQLLATAGSGGELIRDPVVIQLLQERGPRMGPATTGSSARPA